MHKAIRSHHPSLCSARPAFCLGFSPPSALKCRTQAPKSALQYSPRDTNRRYPHLSISTLHPNPSENPNPGPLNPIRGPQFPHPNSCQPPSPGPDPAPTQGSQTYPNTPSLSASKLQTLLEALNLGPYLVHALWGHPDSCFQCCLLPLSVHN